MKRIVYLTLFCLPMILNSCGCSNEQKFVKNPVDELIKDMSSIQNFTIILHDMDVEEGTFSNKYFHTYKIIKEVPKNSTSYDDRNSSVFQLVQLSEKVKSDIIDQVVDSLKQQNNEPKSEPNFELKEETTSSMEVSEQYFRRNENNMGMEIASKSDGKVKKEVAPAGFSNYVGNTKYGHWRTGSGGTSFWEFYGKYAMMRSAFNLIAGPQIYRNHYMDYRSNYYGRGRAYYGRSTGGRYRYGTRSSYMKKSRPSFYSRRASKSSWSSSSRGSSYKSTSRTGSGSMRSGGGGFGK